MGNICFELLQVAVGVRKTMSREMAGDDWRQLFLFCQRQALLGIGFSAVERLHGQGIVCPMDLRLKWYAYVMRIEKRNRKLNILCRELVERMGRDGLRCCILKGQGYQTIYPEDLKWRRTPGDIDVWCTVPDEGLSLENIFTKGRSVHYGHKAIRRYVKQQCRIAKKNATGKACYHHIEAPNLDGTHVEVHYRPTFLHSPIRNRRMQRWFSDYADECMKNVTRLGFAIPTTSVNVVYQICHLYAHFLESGLGLRQFMDYYFTLRIWHDDVMECKDLQSQGMWSEGLGTSVMSREEVMRTLRSFGMGKFAAAVMWVLHEVFDMPTHYYICDPNEKEGRILLSEIMQGGNFGQYDTRDAHMKNGGTVPHAIWKLKRVMRLVGSYPEEALCEPLFRVWHLGWRILHC